MGSLTMMSSQQNSVDVSPCVSSGAQLPGSLSCPDLFSYRIVDEAEQGIVLLQLEPKRHPVLNEVHRTRALTGVNARERGVHHFGPSLFETQGSLQQVLCVTMFDETPSTSTGSGIARRTRPSLNRGIRYREIFGLE